MRKNWYGISHLGTLLVVRRCARLFDRSGAAQRRTRTWSGTVEGFGGSPIGPYWLQSRSRKHRQPSSPLDSCIHTQTDESWHQHHRESWFQTRTNSFYKLRHRVSDPRYRTQKNAR